MVQVAAVSTAGRAYVWSCSTAEEGGRVSSSLSVRVSVEASTSETCAPCPPSVVHLTHVMPTTRQDVWAAFYLRICFDEDALDAIRKAIDLFT